MVTQTIDKNTALVIGIISQLSLSSKTMSKPTTPEELYKVTRDTYKGVEEDLQATRVSVQVSRRGLQKTLAWHPGSGLVIYDTGGGVVQHWTELPDTMLVETAVLLPALLDNIHVTKTRSSSETLRKASEGVMAGLSIPLVPTPTKIAKSLSVEDKPLPIPSTTDVEEEDPEEEEDPDEEDPEEEEGEEEPPPFTVESEKVRKFPSRDEEEVLGLGTIPPPPLAVEFSLPTSRKKKGK